MAEPDAPVVFCLPGFDGTGALFEPLRAALPTSLRMQVHPYGAPARLSQYLDDAHAAIPRDVPVVLLGESFGGPLALELIARGGRDFRGLVLSATFAKPPLSLVVSLAEKLRFASFVLPPVSEQILRVFCLNGVSDIGLIRDIVAVVRQVDQRTIQSRLAALAQMDATARLADIAVPTLLLRGDRDRVVRARFMQPLRDQLRSVEEAVIPGPHLLLQANARDAAAAIQQFVRSRAVTAPADIPTNR